MNKAEIFFDAITGLREELVEEALDCRFRRRVPWGRYAGLAACLALVVCVGWFGLMLAGGGMGGSGADNGFSASSGSSSGGEVSGDTAPPRSSEGGGEASPGSTPELGGQAWETFMAVVLEVHENYLLVEPLEGEAVRNSADRITVSTGQLEDLPVLEAGDVVTVTFDGAVMESYPAQLGEVYSVTRAE